MIELDKIYNEDCLEGMKRIPDHSVDCIICDLPYGTTACAWDSVIPFEPLWEQYNRICKNNSVISLFASQPFTTSVIESNQVKFKYCWYWIKNQATNFFHAKNMPMRRIEEIVIFGGNKYNPQMSDGHVPTRSAKGCSNGNVYYGNNKRNYVGGITTRYPSNILDFKCVDNYSRLHPSQKPVELICYLIRTYTNEGELVLDNCMGSGTTAIAAMREKRHFIGFETNKEYFDKSLKRIEMEKASQRQLIF